MHRAMPEASPLDAQRDPGRSLLPEGSPGWPAAADGGGTRPPTVAELVAEQLARWGVRFVFGLPGEDNMAFLDAVHRHPRLRFYSVRHEQNAALMASAVSKLTGEIAVCTATSGPGTANLINGLADAYADGAAVLAVTGQVERSQMMPGSQQFVDQQQLLGAVTTRSMLLTHPHGVTSILSELLRTAAFQGTTAHLSVPRDLWTQPAPVPVVDPEPYLFTQARSPHHVVQEAARRLSEARRPALVVGIGAAWAMNEVLTLAEKLTAPIIHTLPVGGKIPWQHPLSVGGLGEGGSEASSRILEEADWVFRIGANWWPRSFVPAQGPRIMALDLRPDHIGRGAGAHFGIVGDSQSVLAELNSLLLPTPRPEWERRVAELKARWTEQMSAEASQNGNGALRPQEQLGGIHPARIVSELSAILPHDAIVSLDVGDHVLWFNRHFQGSGQDVLVSGSWRTMGFALPAALAAKLVYPHRPVVAVTGDGGLNMSLPELSTAIQHQLPVTIVLFQNGVLGTEAHLARMEGWQPIGTRLENPDFTRVVGAFGGAGFVVRRPEEIRPQIQAALESHRVALVDIPTRNVTLPAAARRATYPNPQAVGSLVPV